MKTKFIYADVSSWHTFYIKENDILKETPKAYFIRTHDLGRDDGKGIWIAKKLVKPSTYGYQVSVGNDFIIKPQNYSIHYQNDRDAVRGEYGHVRLYEAQEDDLMNGENLAKLMRGEIERAEKLSNEEFELAKKQEEEFKANNPYHQAQKAKQEEIEKKKKEIEPHLQKVREFAKQAEKTLGAIWMKRPQGKAKDEAHMLNVYVKYLLGAENEVLKTIEKPRANSKGNEVEKGIKRIQDLIDKFYNQLKKVENLLANEDK